MNELSQKQLNNMEKLSLKDKDSLLKILEEKDISFKNAKKELKKIKKDYSDISISSISFKLIHSDFRELADTFVDRYGQVDYIITDPPYPKEFLPLYSDLSSFSDKVLKDGGSLICMSGQSYLPEVINRLSEKLCYRWCVAYMTPGGQATQIWPKKINTFWKPLLIFTKGEYKGDWTGDVCRSPVNNNDKSFHHWGQSSGGMIDIIEKFTYPKDLIVDPFVGGGTTGIACLKLRRNFIGIDIDKKCIETSEKRMKEFLEGEGKDCVDVRAIKKGNHSFEKDF
jgi:site-specific DNA-methyltransferase (adenine-specific)